MPRLRPPAVGRAPWAARNASNGGFMINQAAAGKGGGIWIWTAISVMMFVLVTMINNLSTR